MSADPIERPIPFTFNRAVTELVQAERELDHARELLQLALEIVGTLGDDFDLTLSDALEQVLSRVEEAEVVLAEGLIAEGPGRQKLATRSA
jgi:hypothetical protein